MLGNIIISVNKEAAPMDWNGSYADGRNSQNLCLLFTVMGSHVNLSAIDHSEMASYQNRFLSFLLALCAKALAGANINMDKINFHNRMIFSCFASKERLIKSTSSAFFLKKLEHLQKCKCSKTISLCERRKLTNQSYPTQRYGLFPFLQKYS